MSLILAPQHLPGDVERWRELEKEDAAWSRTAAFRARCSESLEHVAEFLSSGPAYAGTSWGKDSTVIAHLVWCAGEELGIDVPLAHVDARPINNPHCEDVRDAFLDRWPVSTYHEEIVWCRRNPDADPTDPAEGWHATGTLEKGFASIAALYGDRYVSGIRGAESAGRRRRMRAYGIATPRTCAPIGNWSARDVFAYLYAHDLPVHPAYAMSMGGSLDRDRLRVAFLGLRHGTGTGRAEWEKTYYPRIADGTPTE